MKNRYLACTAWAAAGLLLTGCGATGTAGGKASTETAQATAEPTQSVTLYMDFTNGGAEQSVQQVTYEYTGKLSPEVLIQGLSDTSGLDFFADVTQTDQAITVDWKANSTLLQGLDERVQKDGYFFYDTQSLDWFMLDSMWQTLSKNYNTTEIYYTMDGGQKLDVPELWPISSFETARAYAGSNHYFSDTEGGDGMNAEQRDRAEKFCTAYFGGLQGEILYTGNAGPYAQYSFTGADGTVGALEYHQKDDTNTLLFVTVKNDEVVSYTVSFGEEITLKDGDGNTYTADTWKK